MNKSEVSWNEAARQWLSDGIGKSPAVLASDRSVVDMLDASFSGRVMASITERDLQQHARRRLEAGRKPRTVNRDLRVFRAIARAAVKRGDIERAPTVTMVRVNTRRLRWITYQQAEQLFRHLPAHQIGPVAFALETGLRKSNVAGLRWDQVDLERAIAWIHADQAKGRRAIGVPLSPTALLVLRGQRGKHPSAVFTYRGEPINQLNTKAYRRALKAAGIHDFTWHDLRRTWASWHAQNGTPMHVLQELGGWADVSMLKVYAHLSVDHLRAHVAANHDRVRDRHPQGRHRVSGSAATRARPDGQRHLPG